jgi:hypothetical protein
MSQNIYNMNLLNIDLQYFANINWYKKIHQYKYIDFSLSDRHVKMSFRNRLWLAGADGRLSLSIPLVDSRNEKQLYREVRIAGGNWAIGHFRTIQSCYNRSPWFDYYRDELAALYNTPHSFLAEWNLSCFNWISRQLPSPVGLHPTGELEPTRRVQPDGWGVVDCRNHYRPGNFAIWKDDFSGRYRQVFEERTGFIPGLSILDLLFCVGKESAVKMLS